MRRHGIDQLSGEVIGAQGLQLGGDLIRQRSVHQRQGLAGVLNHVSVGRAGVQIAAAVRVEQRQRAFEAFGTHPAVAVPGGPAVLQPNPVHHAVAGAPVPARFAGVGAVAQIPAVEFGREVAVDGQIEGGELVGNRSVVAGTKNREDRLRRLDYRHCGTGAVAVDLTGGAGGYSARAELAVDGRCHVVGFQVVLLV